MRSGLWGTRRVAMHTALVWPIWDCTFLPHWGSLHEVLRMQTNISQDTVAVCVALQVAYIYTFRPGPNVSELRQGWLMVLLEFASLVQVESCTWIHSKNTLFTGMPLDGVWWSWWGNLLSFNLKYIHNIKGNGLLDCTVGWILLCLG